MYLFFLCVSGDPRSIEILPKHVAHVSRGKKDPMRYEVDRICVGTPRSALKSRRDIAGAKLTRARTRFVSAEMDPMENSGAAESASGATN